MSQCPHFGLDQLLDLPLYDIDDELLVRERLFKRHALGHSTLGDLWCGANAIPQYWYNPAEHARWRRENAHAREVREAAEKAAQEALRCERLEQLNRIYRREEILGAAVRAKAERERWDAERVRERKRIEREQEAKAERVREAQELENIRLEAEAKRLADIDHEWKRKWAIHTSNVERRITHIVDTVENANGKDREMMRAMLRYMNLGPGLGTQWDVDEFVHYYRSVDVFNYYARIDAERCYLLLRHRNDPSEISECLLRSLVT